MKLTKSKRKWVMDRVAHYSKTLSIDPPEVFMTMAEYNRWKEAKRTHKGERVGRNRSRLWGVCHKDEGFIVILVKKHSHLVGLDHTIRHEMIHLTKSYNHYSPEFKDRMKRLEQGKVRNGRFC